MANLSKQKEAMVGYFRAGCKPEGQLTVGLEVEHFLTHTDGAPAAFEEVQAAMLALQQSGDVPLVQDGETVRLRSNGYVLTLEPAAQLEISITPQKSVGALMAVYEAFAARLRRALAPLGLRAWNLGYHPTRRAAALPLIPKKRYEVMDRYLQKRGRHGTQMMRGTASTQISVDYFSEQDFVRKFRVACLIAPLLALLTDNAPVYEGERNRTASVRTMVWNDVDPDRCGIPPMLMDEDFGFAAYADHVLQKPLIVARHGPRTEGVGRKSAFEVYPSALQKTRSNRFCPCSSLTCGSKTISRSAWRTACPRRSLPGMPNSSRPSFRARPRRRASCATTPGLRSAPSRPPSSASAATATRRRSTAARWPMRSPG